MSKYKTYQEEMVESIKVIDVNINEKLSYIGVYNNNSKEVYNWFPYDPRNYNICQKDDEPERERERERAKSISNSAVTNQQLEQTVNRTPQQEQELQTKKAELAKLETQDNKENKSTNWTPWLVGGGIVLVLVVGIISYFLLRRKKTFQK